MKNEILNKKILRRKNTGIVSLFPAIILSSILLVVVVGGSTTFLSMLWRVSLAEDKSQSFILAKSCLRRAISKYVQNATYAGNETINILGYECVIKPFVDENSAKNIEVSVAIGDAQSVGRAAYGVTTQSIYNENIF